MVLRARHVLPVDGQAIRNGGVLIERGRIVDVGSGKTLDGSPGVDFGDAVILPGLVNAHTHLELTHCAGKIPPGDDLIDWLKRLMAFSKARAGDDKLYASSALEGMRQSLTSGVTTVGDITSLPGTVRPALARGPLRVVSFGEVIAIGSRRHLLEDRLRAAIDRVGDSEYLNAAVSPHAPYTIEPAGIRACVEAAERLDLRLCMHLAESPEEAAFIRTRRGRWRTYLENLGVCGGSIECSGTTPVGLVEECGVLSDRTVLAHCNYVTQEEIELLASRKVHVAYCPRTHAAFGHEPHPFRSMLEAGVNVCVGTDSLASNPSLSVLDEIRHIRRVHPDMSGHILLEMATIRGARALGLDDQIGTLTAGKSADIAVVPFDMRGPDDPVQNILCSTMAPLATYVRGRRIDRPTN